MIRGGDLCEGVSYSDTLALSLRDYLRGLKVGHDYLLRHDSWLQLRCYIWFSSCRLYRLVERVQTVSDIAID